MNIFLLNNRIKPILKWACIFALKAEQSNKMCLMEKGMYKKVLNLLSKGIEWGTRRTSQESVFQVLYLQAWRERYLFVTKATDTQTALLSSKLMQYSSIKYSVSTVWYIWLEM